MPRTQRRLGECRLDYPQPRVQLARGLLQPRPGLLVQGGIIGEPEHDRARVGLEVERDGVAFVGVSKYPARIKCALLPWVALQDAEAKAGIDVNDAPTEREAQNQEGPTA